MKKVKKEEVSKSVVKVKRLPKKVKRKKLTGGFMHVRAYIYSHYAKRFHLKVWGSEMELARDIYFKLRGAGKKIIHANIKAQIDSDYPREFSIRTQKKHPPEIPSNLLGMYHFFDSPRFMSGVKQLPSDLWVKSKMIWGKGIAFRGGTVLDYDYTFKSITDYLGKLDKAFKGSDGEVGLPYDSDMLLRFYTPVSWSNVKKRWEVEIILCDGKGERQSYGWEPTGVDLIKSYSRGDLIQQPELTDEEKFAIIEPKGEEPVIGEEPEVVSAGVKDSGSELRIIEEGKTARAKLAIESLEKMFSTGKITFDQYLLGLEKLK
jgi:hypothetical protein